MNAAKHSYVMRSFLLPDLKIWKMNTVQPELSWQTIDETETDIKLFALMLGNLIGCMKAAKEKASRNARGRSSRKAVELPPRPESPSTFSTISEDVMLRLALFPEHLERNGGVFMQEIYTYAMANTKKMESYMADAYDYLLKTKDHAIMLAAICFYVKWHCEYDPDTNVAILKDNISEQSLIKKLNFDKETVNEICEAAYDFERGRNEITTMRSFLHTLVINHFKRNV